MPTRTPRLLFRAGKAAVTLLAVAIVVLALPLVLAIVVGVPIPHPFSTHEVFGERGLFDLIVVVVWLLWAVNVGLLVRATVAQLRDHGAATRAPGYINRLAVKLAGACLVISTLWGGAAAGAATPSPVTARPGPSVSAPAPTHLMGPVAVTTPTPAATPAPTPPTAEAPPPQAAAVVTVQEGQSLWTIAEQVYGSGADWQLLANANLGHVMNDGLVFSDPNLIYPGWQLTAPPADTPLAPASAPAPPLASATTAAPVATARPGPAPTAAPVSPVPPVVRATAKATRADGSRTTANPPGKGTGGVGPAIAHPAAPASAMAEAAANARETAARHHDDATHPAVAVRRGSGHGLDLAELALLGSGALCAAVLARRVRWNRRRSRLDRRPGQETPFLSEEAEAVAADVVPFEALPALTMLEFGLCHLTHAIGLNQESVPRTRLVRIGPDGLALILDEAADVAPGAFRVEADGHAWVLRSDVDFGALEGAHDGEPWLTALVPVGESPQGTYLVPVEPGVVVPVAGPKATEALAAMMVVASAWEWTEASLTVTDDAAKATEVAGWLDPAETIERTRVLYFGDPGALEDVTRSRIGVVTLADVAPSDTGLRCEEGETLLEPFNLELVPAGLNPAQAAAVDELLANSLAQPVDPTEPVDVGSVVTEAGGVVFPAPGPIDVRVLVPLPRVEGTGHDPPESRQARAVELLAYLALKGGPVPPYEARAEAMATHGKEGAATSLRMVATDLRKWVGAEHMPVATQAGYRVGDEVTTDLGRLQAAVKLARSTDDPDEREALLRPALALIEGKPASQTKRGWGWWDTYEMAAEDAAADAACMLAPILAERGDAKGARWVIEQARLLGPWNELLYRLSIMCGGVAGNAAWVEREMRACEAMVEELAPGASPSEDTYEAYRLAMSQFGVPA